MENEEKTKTALRIYDPSGYYYKMVQELAKFHFEENPDGVNEHSRLDFGRRAGITALLRHVICKEHDFMLAHKKINKKILES